MTGRGFCGRGFWAKGEELIDLGTTRSHIRYILDHPDRFDFSREELLDCYKEHGEPIGFEGKARAEIMRRALRGGWIRVRERPATGWIVQIDADARRPEAEALVARLRREKVVGDRESILIGNVDTK